MPPERYTIRDDHRHLQRAQAVARGEQPRPRQAVFAGRQENPAQWLETAKQAFPEREPLLRRRWPRSRAHRIAGPPRAEFLLHARARSSMLRGTRRRIESAARGPWTAPSE